MHSWPSPSVPRIPGSGTVPLLWNTASQGLEPAARGQSARMYVCGITPYDATHMGHAATYVSFDLLHRALRDAGVQVSYVQNITDVDDPLLERATQTGVDWQDLAAAEIARFRDDMTALGVLPPTHYIGAVESIGLVVDRVEEMRAAGDVYGVDAPDAVAATEGGVAQDFYLRVSRQPGFGQVAALDEPAMRELFAERGGDPDRDGKAHPLDALVWRAAREGEPSWDGRSLGRGRPGWHIECSAIAREYVGLPLDVQGGGSDLAFPHHEMSAAHAAAMDASESDSQAQPFAHLYAHVGMVSLGGHKMSKSRGNLVFVSALRAAGEDPMAIRVALLSHHWRSEWEWDELTLPSAYERLEQWREALAVGCGADPMPTLAAMREALSNDLDAPAALGAVDAWVKASASANDTDFPDAAGIVVRALDALLGIRL